jgi:ribose 5-phosphate isomerase A
MLNRELDANSLKRAAAEAAAALVEDGMVVGLGTGSTAAFAVEAIGKRVQGGLRILGVPTSAHTSEQARALGIPLAELTEDARVDLTIDGADEVEMGRLDLIKGRGGALLREKIVASVSKRLVIVIDESKIVERLGRGALPVEVVPFGWRATMHKLRNLGVTPSLRKIPDGGPFISDGGHYILDCVLSGECNPASLKVELDSVVGVVEHGLFMGMASQVIVAGTGGLRILSRS